MEAHGTGTLLGDPVEAQALIAVYGQRVDPVWLGSLKSNIGHAQAAAGVGGVIKAVMAMRHGVLPRTLHVDSPSPHVDWSSGSVELLTSARPWPVVGRPRRAAVSSFGVSGTNAHVILEAGPVSAGQELSDLPEMIGVGTRSPQGACQSESIPLVVTARGVKALRARVEQVRELVPNADIAFSLVTTRAMLEHRAVVVGDQVVEGVADVEGDVCFVFPGQGSQWAGMAVDLIAAEPAFVDRMRECAEALEPEVEWDLFEVLDDAKALERVDVVQPALWAVMVSLAHLWRGKGVEPKAVVGHSQGEIAAAVTAGALSVVDGARVVARRSWLIARKLAGRGGMMVVTELPSDPRLAVAAINGPRSIVVAGDLDALEALDGKRIPVDFASHSPQVEELRDDLIKALDGITPKKAEIEFFSTVDEKWIDTTELNAEYWYRNVRQTVLFESAVRTLVEHGHRKFIEISPHPVLTVAVEETVEGAAVSGTLHRDDGGVDRFVRALGEAFVRGVEVDWAGMFPGARKVKLPTYPFQRRRYWLDADHTAEPAADAAEDMVELVCATTKAVLRLEDDEFDAGKPFRDMGVDSLLAVELRNRLATATGRRLAATIVFEQPTPVTLAAFLNGESVTTETDFAGEIGLAEDIQPAVRATGEPREILLTGATGFLGAFLLRDLLDQTTARVHCLVRAEDDSRALARLKNNLDWYGLEVDLERVRAVTGDLAEPRLGLDEQRFDELAHTIDVVYHAGARVSWLEPYQELKAANVKGTEEVLRLAARHRTAKVHYVSTTGVFARPGGPKTTDAETGPVEQLPTGYQQSKWVAEEIVREAQRRGLPVTVYRVDTVCGSRVSGACQTNDFVWRSLKGCLQAKAVPAQAKALFTIAPVDYVSAAIVGLSKKPKEPKQATYHLCSSEPVSLNKLVDRLRHHGHQLEELPREQWNDRVRSDPDNAANALLDVFTEATQAEELRITYDAGETAEAGFPCPEITDDLLDTCIRFFERTGYFPQ
nr:thioester reductase domain-containing protein [Lentzea kentuckyensis]